MFVLTFSQFPAAVFKIINQTQIKAKHSTACAEPGSFIKISTKIPEIKFRHQIKGIRHPHAGVNTKLPRKPECLHFKIF